MSKNLSALTAAILFVASALAFAFPQLAFASETVTTNSSEIAEQLLSQIGLGVIEWVIFLVVLIIVVAFQDGKGRREDEN